MALCRSDLCGKASFFILAFLSSLLLSEKLQKILSADVVVVYSINDRTERQRERKIVLGYALYLLSGRSHVHVTQLLNLDLKDARNFDQHFVGGMATTQFDVRDKCRRAIELFGEFTERKV